MPRSDDSRSGMHRFLPDSREPVRQRPRRPIAFATVFLLGLLISWFVYDLLATKAANDLQRRFDREANQIKAKLQTQFDLSFEYLHAIPPFFQASDDVSKEDFRQFVAEALDRHSVIHTLEYLPKVSAKDRVAFEEAARAKLKQSDFTIRAVDMDGNEVALPEREAYFPVYYGEPRIEKVLGVDLASHPEQGPYVQKACSSAVTIATPPISLIEDQANVLSVIAFAPIREFPSQSSADCVGLAALILRIEPVVQLALGNARLNEFELTLIDLDAGHQGKLVYKNYPGEALAPSNPKWAHSSREIRFADQAWEFHISPAKGSEFAVQRSPIWVLLAGSVLSALAAYSLSATMAIGGLRKAVDEAIELGQYRLGRKLGEGGMGIVYEAEHRMLARPAAIKLIRLDPNHGGNDISPRQSIRLSRFEKEAKATARLESPHTISIYDFGKTLNGEFYYVMELLDGTDLSTLVKKFGPIPPARMIYLMHQACLSLAEAHQEGLIHRDIKPANIFVCKYALEYDFVKVLDFGLVKSSEPEASVEITQAGSLIGTPAFIAPEMLVGGLVDGRTDIYSLGCVMYWLLTGNAPFVGQTPTAVMAQHLNSRAESLRLRLGDEVSEELDSIVLQCLSKKPQERPRNAQELGERLSACATSMSWSQAQAKQCWQVERMSQGIPMEHDTHRNIALEGTIRNEKN